MVVNILVYEEVVLVKVGSKCNKKVNSKSSKSRNTFFVKKSDYTEVLYMLSMYVFLTYSLILIISLHCDRYCCFSFA